MTPPPKLPARPSRAQCGMQNALLVARNHPGKRAKETLKEHPTAKARATEKRRRGRTAHGTDSNPKVGERSLASRTVEPSAKRHGSAGTPRPTSKRNDSSDVVRGGARGLASQKTKRRRRGTRRAPLSRACSVFLGLFSVALGFRYVGCILTTHNSTK